MKGKCCSTCNYCDLEDSYWGDICKAKCSITGLSTLAFVVDDINETPKWCPFNYVPDNKELKTCYDTGWNDCINEMLRIITKGDDNGKR